MEERDAQRREALSRIGADGPTTEELLAGNRSRHEAVPPVAPSLPLPDEPHLEAWTAYADESARLGAWGTLSPRFPQLRFPIRAGISGEEGYLRATRRGEIGGEGEETTLLLRSPAALKLEIHRSLAGKVPVLSTVDREDFAALVRAFTARNEPREVPPSMGACLVAGLNNWDRIWTHRRRWELERGVPASDEEWREEFRRLAERPELYRDRFILLSRGPYSNVEARAVGLDEAEWIDRSFEIRKNHEATHYATLRLLGLLQHNILEEIVADAIGLLLTFGRYDCAMALLFLGLEGFPAYRAGGRLENYCHGLSAGAFRAQTCLAHAAVESLGRFFASRPGLAGDPIALAQLVLAVTPMSLEELSAEGAAAALAAAVPGG